MGLEHAPLCYANDFNWHFLADLFLVLFFNVTQLCNFLVLFDLFKGFVLFCSFLFFDYLFWFFVCYAVIWCVVFYCNFVCLFVCFVLLLDRLFNFMVVFLFSFFVVLCFGFVYFYFFVIELHVCYRMLEKENIRKRCIVWSMWIVGS